MRRWGVGLAGAAAGALVAAAVWASWAGVLGAVPAALLPRDVPARELRVGGTPPATEFWLEPGYRLELVAGGLTYPTALEFGPRGELWVAEAGYSPGGATAVPRVVRVLRGGVLQEVCRLPDGPVTGLAYRDGFLYAIGGRAPAKVWSYHLATGELRTVVTGLATWGRHYTSELRFGPDGRLYFAVGTPSNSGVICAEDYYTYGYLGVWPEARDIPAVALEVTGRTFASGLLPGPAGRLPGSPTTGPGGGPGGGGGPAPRTVLTGAFQPFGQPGGGPGSIVLPGRPPAVTGAVFRVHPDGTGLELLASGLRHVVGLGFAPDGRLLAFNLGMKNRGARPIAGDADALWAIEPGGWYGFPDFASGQPVAAPPLLSRHPPLAPGPLLRLASLAGTHGFDLAPGGRFAHPGQLFAAQHGSYFRDPPDGHRIIRIDLETYTAHDFYINLSPGPPGCAPERPTSVRFGPDDNLYVVDYGHLTTSGNRLYPSALTGAIWRISPRRPLISGR